MENERKFKIKYLFDLDTFKDFTYLTETYISQYYLTTSECDLRVRHQKNLTNKETKFILTLKSLDEGVYRQEYNIEIPAEDGKSLINSSLVKSHIGKYRTSWKYINEDISSIDIDTFSKNSNVTDPETGENLAGIIEIEFPSKILAEKFVPYHWLGEEVTSDSRFRNMNLATGINSKGTRILL